MKANREIQEIALFSGVNLGARLECLIRVGAEHHRLGKREQFTESNQNPTPIIP